MKTKVLVLFACAAAFGAACAASESSASGVSSGAQAASGGETSVPATSDGFRARLAGTGGVATNVALKLEGDISFSAKKFLTRETERYEGTVDMTGVTSVTLTDAEVLSDAALLDQPRHRFIVADALVLPEGGLADIRGVPAGWALVADGNSVHLGPRRGMTVLFRKKDAPSGD